MNKLKAVMLLPLVLLLAVFTLIACTPDKKTVSDVKGELPLAEYTVQGYPLQCVTYGAYKMSCNWEKYNRLVEEANNE